MHTAPTNQPKAFVLALFFVFVIEAFLGHPPKALWRKLFEYSEPMPQQDPLRFRAQAELIKMQGKPVIVLLGSSQMREGIDGIVLQERLTATLGGIPTVINLSTAGTELLDLLLQFHFIRHVKPDWVIAMPTMYSTFRPYSFGKLKLYLYGFSSLLETVKIYGWSAFWKAGRDWLGGAIVANLLPSYRFFSSYKAHWLIRPMLAGHLKDRAPKWFQYDRSRDVDFDLGSSRTHKQLHNVYAMRANDQSQRIMRDIVYAFARAVTKEGGQLMMVPGPYHPILLDRFEVVRSAQKRYDTFMNHARRRVKFLNIRHNMLPEFLDSDFYDPYHLNKYGREKLTRFLADQIVLHIKANRS